MFDSALKPVWWLPTVGFFLFLGIEFWMFAGADRMFEDPGVGRHLRTAEAILESGHIPRTDPLSFTKAGQPWIDYEWGFETTLGELYRAGGLALVCAFCYALFATTILGIYRMLLHSGLPTFAVLLYTGLAFTTLHLHFAVRPLLFTYLFLALVIEVWHRHPEPRKREWLLLPLIFFVWANVHAGWAAALVFLVGSLFGRLLDRLSGRVDGEEAHLIPWTALTLLCALATSFNPWGWKLHREIFLFATSYKSFALWDEYLPPNFGTPTMSAITVLFIVTIVFLARLFKRAPLWRWETVLPVLFFLYQGLKAQRHVLLLVEVAAIPVARDLSALLNVSWLPLLRNRLEQFQEQQGLETGNAWEALKAIFTMGILFLLNQLRQFEERQRMAAGDAWLALMAALVLAALFVRTPIGHNIEVGKSVSPELLTFLRQHPDRFHRPLTTTWNAGPLLWNMRPDFRVSFDDRGDFYGDDTVFSFVDVYNAIPGWRDTLEKGRYDSALLDPQLQLNQFLTSVPGWKEVYRDKKTVVYWKDAPAAPQLK